MLYIFCRYKRKIYELAKKYQEDIDGTDGVLNFPLCLLQVFLFLHMKNFYLLYALVPLFSCSYIVVDDIDE